MPIIPLRIDLYLMPIGTNKAKIVAIETILRKFIINGIFITDIVLSQNNIFCGFNTDTTEQYLKQIELTIN